MLIQEQRRTLILKTTILRTAAAELMLCAMLAGCGGANMSPVSGTVSHNGATVSSGRVVFRPEGAGAVAVGAIQSDGTFQLTTKRSGDGAVVGQYRVMIAGDMDATDKRLRVSYLSPKEPPLEVVAGKDNQFVINVREKDGWEVLGGKD